MTTSAFEAPLERAFAHALHHLRCSDETSVAATSSLAELRSRLQIPLAEEGVDPTQVIDELVGGCDGGITGSTGGRFFGWVMGGATPAALAAD